MFIKFLALLKRSVFLCVIIQALSAREHEGLGRGVLVQAYCSSSSMGRIKKGGQPLITRLLDRKARAPALQRYHGTRSVAVRASMFDDEQIMFDTTEKMTQDTFSESAMTNTDSPFLEVAGRFLLHELQSPFLWSTICVVCMILLLYGWKSSLDAARNSLPETLQPVVNIILLEMAGLGYVSLLLNALVTDGPGAAAISEWSRTYLGNSDLLWKCYQVVDASCLKVSTTFFALSAFTVMNVAQQVHSIEVVCRASFDIDGDGEVELSEIAQVLDCDSLLVDLDGDGELSKEEISIALRRIPTVPFWNELTRTEKVAQAETLVVRERLCQRNGIDEHGGETAFALEKYFVKIFSQNLGLMLELSPLVWLMMIPLVAMGRSIDLSNDIAGESEANAFLSSGEFISSAGYVEASVFFAGLNAVWGVWNFWKLVKIKNMLVPILVRDTATENPSALLLPPRYEDDEQMETFDSSPFPFDVVESIWGEPPRNRQEALFGAAGRKGPHLYLESVKLQTWFSVAQLIFFLNQIVGRDAAALIQGSISSAGRPDMVLPELALFGFICCLGLGQLWLLPKTFMIYNLVTSIESLVSADILSNACLLDGKCDVEVAEVKENKKAREKEPSFKTLGGKDLSPVTALQANTTDSMASAAA